MQSIFKIYWKCISVAWLNFESVEEYIDWKLWLKEDVEDYDAKNRFMNEIVDERVLVMSLDAYFIYTSLIIVVANSNLHDQSREIISAI